MDITPELHVLESRKNDRMGWHDCLAELIDNAFDAGATRAVVEWKDGRFAIEDDGRGMSDVSVALRLGCHRRQETTALGTYGVGVKDAWAWLSNDISIKTTRDGVTTTLHVSRNKIRQVDGRWVCEDPIARASVQGEIGTRIVFGPLYAGRRTAQQDTFSRLAVTFMPAILSGKQIVVVQKGKRSPLVAYRLPAMQEAVEESFEVGGRPVSIHIGIAQEGERIEEPGFLFCFRHRVVKVSNLGTKHYNAERMIGRVILGDGWVLTPHKKDFAEDSEDLEDAIFSRIESLLAKSDQMSDIVESNAIRAELEGMINACVRDARAKEKRPGCNQSQPGTRFPTNSGRKRINASVFDPKSSGSVELSQPGRRGFQIKWAAIGDTTLGKCYTETRTVVLNIENQFVRTMKEQKNRAALFAVAVGILCYADDNIDGEQRLVVPRGEFAMTWGAVMSSLKAKEFDSAAAN